MKLNCFNGHRTVISNNVFFVAGSIVCFSLFMACASYGAGGVYTSNNQTELGGYIYGDSKFTETTVSYTVNLSDAERQSLGIGVSLKIPVPVWKITVFPLANIEYQRILSEKKTVRNLGWLRLGGGVDFSITDAFYLRGEGLYAPGLFPALRKSDVMSLNQSAGYAIRLGLGWKPEVSTLTKPKTSPANTGQDQKSAPPVNDKSGWDIAGLDTARNASYLSDLEKDIILEMNMARSNPKKYAEMYINPNQGAFARECYAELRKSKSLSVLMPKRGLSQAAKDHVADTGPKGITGHSGSDGSSMGDRINRYGTWRSGASENISYGYNTAREIVLQLLIDDGVESRGHRRNIMNGDSKFVGVAVGAHNRYRFMCVQNFAYDYIEKVSL